MFQHFVTLDILEIVFFKVCSTKYILLKKVEYFLLEFKMYSVIEGGAIHSMDTEGKDVSVVEDTVRE